MFEHLHIRVQLIELSIFIIHLSNNFYQLPIFERTYAEKNENSFNYTDKKNQSQIQYIFYAYYR